MRAATVARVRRRGGDVAALAADLRGVAEASDGRGLRMA